MSRYIPDRILEEIRFRNDIVEVISGYVPLKRTGSTYKACCPFHKEKTPSFNVNPNMQIFKCFGCGEGGDVIGFVMKHQGLDFVSAARVLADRAGIELELQDNHGEAAQRKALYAIHHGVTQFFRRCLVDYPAAGHARDYLAQRGLDEATAEAFDIGYAPAGWDNSLKWGEKYGYSPDQLERAGLVLRSKRQDRKGTFYDRFRDRLMFPIHDSQGRVVAFSARILVDDKKQPKYVNSPETPIFSKSRILYGLDKARRNIVNSPAREALICEGQIDVVRCHQKGFQTAVAAQGTAFTDEHVQLLKNYADSVVLVFDSDPAGQSAAIKTSHLLMQTGLVVRVAVLPAGHDPDTFLREKGCDAFRDQIEHALSIVAYQIRILSEQEADSRGIAATARIANAVLDTLCHCPQAVQRERMLQEAASLLGIAQEALDADFRVMQAAQHEKARRYQQRDDGSGMARQSTPTRISGAPAHAHPPLDEEEHWGNAEYDEHPPPDVMEALIDFDTDSEASSLERNQGASTDSAIPPEERALCEHLVQGGGDAELVALVADNLPLTWLQSEQSRWIVEHVLQAAEAGVPLNAILNKQEQVSDDGSGSYAFLESLLRDPVRIKGGDYTRQDAVKDLILGFWRRHLQQERQQLSLPDSNGENESNAARRMQITMDLKALRHWETGLDVIQIESAMLEA